MAEPDNQTLRLLRELRSAMQKLDDKVDALDDKLDRKIDHVHDDLGQKIKNLQQAMIGESVLGRYAVAEVEERLDAIEKRLGVLEQT